MTAVRVACHQLAPVVGDLEGNRRRALRAVERAAAAGAHLVVLPELVSSGYVFRDAAEAASLAEPADGPTLAGWREAAARHDLVVVGGFCERDEDGRVRNSAAIVDAGGVRALYRKAHLWDLESDAFVPGDAPPPVVSTAAGRLGLMVCYDLEFPEWVRRAALAGAEVLCVPTNWPAEPRPAGERPMEVLRAMVAAATNKVFVAAADRCGRERGVDWVQGTAIVGPDGWLLTELGPGERLVVADVELAHARDKALNQRNDVFADRRPELY